MSTEASTSRRPTRALLPRSAQPLLTCLTCLTGLMLAVAAPVAHAATWTPVGSVPNTWTESVDTSSIVREGAIRRAWVQIRYDRPTAVAHGVAPASMLKQRVAFNCTKHQASLMTRLSYDAQGQLIDRVDMMPTVGAGKFFDVDPDTEWDNALTAVCAH
ncbi:surface-adhesin E family protein [Paraburkholderia tropica]|uniref:surface-adhesin E family protein n=1 Tax=Paraburkholderia tropica TaxID=92647 RepID=UPI002AB66636|nr:surface-adhesin E family protein [Paraburkholderia tropica]